MQLLFYIPYWVEVTYSMNAIQKYMVIVTQKLLAAQL